jgi:uncharacterized short protein YbdD (DUF466 family)
MDLVLSEVAVMQDYIEYEEFMAQFAPGMPPVSYEEEFVWCECGKRIEDCKDAYSHMSRGY